MRFFSNKYLLINILNSKSVSKSDVSEILIFLDYLHKETNPNLRKCIDNNNEEYFIFNSKLEIYLFLIISYYANIFYTKKFPYKYSLSSLGFTFRLTSPFLTKWYFISKYSYVYEKETKFITNFNIIEYEITKIKED